MTLEEIRRNAQVRLPRPEMLLIDALAQHVEALQKPAATNGPHSLVSSWTWTCPKCGQGFFGNGPPKKDPQCCFCNGYKTLGEQIALREIVHNGIACDGQDRFLLRPNKSPQATVFAGTNAIEDRELAEKKLRDLRATVAYLIDFAVAEEREHCARIAESIPESTMNQELAGVCCEDTQEGFRRGRRSVACSIRLRHLTK